MQTIVKENMIRIIEDQPDDSSYNEILKELFFAEMIEKGLEDSRDQKTIDNDEMKREIHSWSR